MRDAIEALLRAVDRFFNAHSTADRYDAECLLGAAAAAVRAELVREPDQSFATVLRDIEARLAIGTLYTAERELLERSQNAIKTLSVAVARAARGEKP